MSDVNEMTRKEMYSLFKTEMCDSAKQVFNNSKEGEMGPVIFLGVRKDIMMREIAAKPELKKQYQEFVDLAGDHADLVMGNAIHCAMIPLGRFFEDHKIPALNQMSKDLARQMIQEIVTGFQKLDINAVMFSAFISEAWFAEHHMSEEEKNKMKMGKSMPDPVEEHYKNGGSVRTMNGSTEKLMLSFETRLGSQMCTYDIARFDDSEKREAVNFKEYPWSNNPAQGLFTGILHNSQSPNVN